VRPLTNRSRRTPSPSRWKCASAASPRTTSSTDSRIPLDRGELDKLLADRISFTAVAGRQVDEIAKRVEAVLGTYPEASGTYPERAVSKRT
jgi:hypothetical protein